MLVRRTDGGYEVRNIENPRYNLTGEQLVSYLGWDQGNTTGKHISPETAITGTIAVYACVNIVAGTISTMPQHLYGLTDERPRVRPSDGGWQGRTAKMLEETPNDEWTAEVFKFVQLVDQMLWGTSVHWNERGKDGRVRAMWRLRPDKLRKVKAEGETFYAYESDDNFEPPKAVFAEDELSFIPWVTTDGKRGLSPITVARQAIGIEQSAADFAGRWYANGALPSAVLSIPRGDPNRFNARAREYGEHVKQLWGGQKNAGRIAVIEDSMDLKTLSMPLEDMQFLDTRRFQIEEIARLYAVPPWLIGETMRSTAWGTGLETMKQGFLDFTIRPILGRIEGVLNRDLGVVPGVRTLRDDGYFVEYLTAEFVRADIKTRYETYALGVQSHTLLPNEARRAENLPPVEGGDEFPTLQGQADTPPPADDSGARDAAFLAVAQRALEPQQLTIPTINVEAQPAPNVQVYAQDVSGEVRDAVAAIAPPVVDTSAIAQAMSEMDARRTKDAADAEARALKRHAELLQALLAPRSVTVERDDNGNMTGAQQRVVVPFERKVG